MNIEDIRDMLADLPPSDWERQMAEVTAREAALTADRDRWKRMYEDEFAKRDELHARAASLVAERDELQRQLTRTTVVLAATGQECDALRERLAEAHYKLSLADVYLAKMRESWEAANQQIREGLAAGAEQVKRE